jgi:hypothetical protein
MRPLFTHTIALARALRTVQISHALHDLLAAVAVAMDNAGSASISKLSIDLGVSFEAVRVMLAVNEDLIEQVSDGTKPRGYQRQYRLTADGLALLSKITKTTELCLPTR